MKQFHEEVPGAPLVETLRELAIISGRVCATDHVLVDSAFELDRTLAVAVFGDSLTRNLVERWFDPSIAASLGTPDLVLARS